MATRQITTDDITGATIEGDVMAVTLTFPARVEIFKDDKGKENKVEIPETSFTLDVSGSTFSALASLALGSPAGLAEIMATTFKSVRKSSGSDDESEIIRAWAKENGVEVKDRGRVPADVIAKFRAAHPAK